MKVDVLVLALRSSTWSKLRIGTHCTYQYRYVHEATFRPTPSITRASNFGREVGGVEGGGGAAPSFRRDLSALNRLVSLARVQEVGDGDAER